MRNNLVEFLVDKLHSIFGNVKGISDLKANVINTYFDDENVTVIRTKRKKPLLSSATTRLL